MKMWHDDVTRRCDLPSIILKIWLELLSSICFHMNGVQHNYPNTKKDESLRNFHWCLIRTLHNYPFSTDWKSISVFLSMYKQEINTRSWFLFPDIFKVFPMIFHRWYDMRSIRKNARTLRWLVMAPEPNPGQGLDDHSTPHSNLVFPL